MSASPRCLRSRTTLLSRRAALGAALAVLPGCWRGVFPVPWRREDYAAQGWRELGRARAWNPEEAAAPAGGEPPMYVGPCPCKLAIPLLLKEGELHQLLVQISWTELNTAPRALQLTGLSLERDTGAEVPLPGTLDFSSQDPARIVSVPAGLQPSALHLEIRTLSKLAPRTEAPLIAVFGK